MIVSDDANALAVKIMQLIVDGSQSKDTPQWILRKIMDECIELRKGYDWQHGKKID